ncbi:MAG: hypothetical protein AB1423_16935 [Pseudomonadota bacterium]
MRKLVLALMLSVLLLGFGSAMAATSSFDNIPGGGGFNYFHASAAGDETLFNLQNVDVTPIRVHLTLYDSNSNKLIDFSIPLSNWDNWGCSITGDGTLITITPQTPCFYVGANNGCFPPVSIALPAGADGLQVGYMSFVVSAGDSAFYGGNNDGDPRNDPIAGFATARFFDVIAGRTALLNPVSGSAIAINSTMLQGYVNIYNAPGLVEAAAGISGGWDSIADAGVPFLWNCDLDILDTFPSHDDPLIGINIDSWEIMLTNWATWSVIADDFNADVVGETLYQAVGSPTWYVGRYNETPGLSSTVLITVFPANSGGLPVAFSPACGFTSRTITSFCYDDNELPLSDSVSPPEVGRVAFGSAVNEIIIPATSGECRFLVDAPMLGFTYTEAGNYADLYPLIKVDQLANVADIFFLVTGHALDGAVTEVIEIGVQETY